MQISLEKKNRFYHKQRHKTVILKNSKFSAKVKNLIYIESRRER